LREVHVGIAYHYSHSDEPPWRPEILKNEKLGFFRGKVPGCLLTSGFRSSYVLALPPAHKDKRNKKHIIYYGADLCTVSSVQPLTWMEPISMNGLHPCEYLYIKLFSKY